MAATDLNLLFGMLALQLDFISRDQLLAGMQAWVHNKTTPLGQILRDQGALADDRLQLLDALVKKHLEAHNNDPQQSLDALTSRPSAREVLERIDDDDLQATLGFVDNGRQRTPVLEPAPQGDAAALPTDTSPRFRILRPHAKGGIGIVFVAHDCEVNRQVALKEIQLERANDPDSRARFLLEAEITGGLEHPGIVPVYGLGHYADGRPYYAMRFIRGDSLREAIDAFHKADVPGQNPTERDLAQRQLLRRFIDVCNAIEYAHSKGVLHRDLKPGNIMLGKYGETLVVDWGLARAIDDTPPSSPESTVSVERRIRPQLGSGLTPTQTGSALGTPAFMSPEQAAGRLDQLGPASDVYSLGATLYCVLTGQIPFTQKDVAEIFDNVAKGSFPRPRQIKPAVDPALEAICLKAMAKEPADRYASAIALRKDLENWIADAPVEARPDPLRVKVRRWIGRHRVVAAASIASLVLAVAFLGILAAVTGAANEKLKKLAADESTAKTNAEAARKDADHEKNVANEQTRIAKKQTELADKRADDLLEESRRLSIATGFAADGAFESGNVERARDYLNEIPVAFRGWEWRYRQRRFQGSYMTLIGDLVALSSLAIRADGQRLVSSGNDMTLKVWDARTGNELLTLRGHGFVTSVAFSADGQRIVSGSLDKTLKVWDARTGTELLTLRGHSDRVFSVAFSTDGQRIVSGSKDKTLKVWDARTGAELLTLRGHSELVKSVAISADGQRLVSGGDDKTLKVWDARTGTELRTLRGHSHRVTSVVFSADGQRIVSGSDDKTLKMWDARTGTELLTLRGHSDTVKSVTISSDGQRLVSGSSDKTLKVWDARTGSELLTLRGHSRAVNSVAISADGQRLVSGSDDKTLKMWDARNGGELRTLRGHSHRVTSVVFSADNQRLVSGSWDKTLKVWDARMGSELLTLRGHSDVVTSVALSADGQRIVSGSKDTTLKVWDARTGNELLTLRGHSSAVNSVAISADGQRIVSGSDDKTLKVWDARIGSELLILRGHSFEVSSVAFCADGQRIVSGAKDPVLRIWDTRTGTELLTLRPHFSKVTSVAFSADAQRIVSGSEDSTLKVWDARTGKELLVLRGGANFVNSVAFSPDGQRLVSGNDDGTLKVWDAGTGSELLTLRGGANFVNSVAFSPDGQRLVSGNDDGTLRIWDAPTESPRSEEVRQFRIAMSRFDGVWHFQKAMQARVDNQTDGAFRAAYHWGQLALHEPLVAGHWNQLLSASKVAGNDALPLEIADRVLNASPELAPLYFRRAQVRAQHLQFAEASSDQLMGLIFESREAKFLALDKTTRPEESIVPAARQFAVALNRDGGTNIYLASAAGPGLQNLTKRFTRNISPAWSADGKTIAVDSQGTGGKRQIYAIDAQGGPWRLLTNENLPSFSPSWSADGRKIAFQRATTDPRKPSICVMDADGRNQTKVGEGFDPALSPDGKSIAFAQIGAKGYRLFVMDSSGGNAIDISKNDNPFGFVWPAWSPDGKKLAWTDSSGGKLHLIVADADGQNAKQLTKGGVTNTSAAWSPDGKQIAFLRSVNGTTGHYYVMDADGNNVRQLLPYEVPITNGRIAWRPN